VRNFFLSVMNVCLTSDMSIAKNIRRFREAAKLTQDELGERLGWTGAAISNYEREVQTPAAGNLSRIAEALGVTVSDLVGDRKDDPRVAQQAAELDELRARIEKTKGIPDDMLTMLRARAGTMHPVDWERLYDVIAAVLGVTDRELTRAPEDE
jgi:transcriptional regulator with XRE-family HTH domain